MAFWDKDKIATTEGGITIMSVREDVPKFKREYSAALSDGRSIKITIYNLMRGHRSNSGELTQRDGKWILFDPERIAEKILDPNLVPQIERLVAEIFRLDRDFMHNRPGEYMDENGETWQRL